LWLHVSQQNGKKMNNNSNLVPSYDLIAGKWKQHAGAAKIMWGKLTDDEILKTEGQLEKLVGIVQEKYAISRDVADQQVDEFMKSLKS